MIKTLVGRGTLKSRLTVMVVFLVVLAAALVAYVSLQLGERQMRDAAVPPDPASHRSIRDRG